MSGALYRNAVLYQFAIGPEPAASQFRCTRGFFNHSHDIGSGECVYLGIHGDQVVWTGGGRLQTSGNIVALRGCGLPIALIASEWIKAVP